MTDLPRNFLGWDTIIEEEISRLKETGINPP
jgi:hypothetical protein